MVACSNWIIRYTYKLDYHDNNTPFPFEHDLLIEKKKSVELHSLLEICNVYDA